MRVSRKTNRPYQIERFGPLILRAASSGEWFSTAELCKKIWNWEHPWQVKDQLIQYVRMIIVWMSYNPYKGFRAEPNHPSRTHRRWRLVRVDD